MKPWMATLLSIALVMASGALATPNTHRSSSGSHRPSGSHHSGGSHQSSTRYHSIGNYYGSKLSRKASGVPRDSKGRIERSSKATSAFKSQHACPSTGKHSGACPGYVIDHVTPLKRGGADSPSNMQWQTKEAAKAKDRVE